MLTISIQDIDTDTPLFDIYDLYGKQVMIQLGNTNNTQVAMINLTAGTNILQAHNSLFLSI